VVGSGFGIETLDVEVEGITEQTAELAKIIHVGIYRAMYESWGAFLVVEV
jgi:hypothetical protein